MGDRLVRLDNRLAVYMVRLVLWSAFKPAWVGYLATKFDDGVEWCRRVVFCHHNARVLSDMEYRFGCVLDHIGTGMSKAYYPLDAMYAEIDRAIQERINEALADGS